MAPDVDSFNYLLVFIYLFSIVLHTSKTPQTSTKRPTPRALILHILQSVGLLLIVCGIVTLTYKNVIVEEMLYYCHLQNSSTADVFFF